MTATTTHRAPRTEAIRADQVTAGDTLTTVTNRLDVTADALPAGPGNVTLAYTAWDEARGRRIPFVVTMRADAVVIRYTRPVVTA